MLVGRGVLRNPWILAQAADLAGRPGCARRVTAGARQFLLEYIELLDERRRRRTGSALGRANRPDRRGARHRRGRERWVINKVRALGRGTEGL